VAEGCPGLHNASEAPIIPSNLIKIPIHSPFLLFRPSYLGCEFGLRRHPSSHTALAVLEPCEEGHSWLTGANANANSNNIGQSIRVPHKRLTQMNSNSAIIYSNDGAVAIGMLSNGSLTRPMQKLVLTLCFPFCLAANYACVNVNHMRSGILTKRQVPSIGRL
jgi:hypothetical protein